MENSVERIEKKLDRVSTKLKEIIKYLNEKATSRQNRKSTNLLEEMKKMSDVTLYKDFSKPGIDPCGLFTISNTSKRRA